MKIGSLCTGYGGLDMAVEAVFAAETIWVSEIDKYASQVIEQRFGLPNHGDLKAINWAELEPIDILTAGYPCQPFSHAGYRKGTDDERHIFPYILEAISTLRPKYAIMENVRGHLSLGLKEVLQGLASIGYDAQWRLVRASDVGAPHQRARIFIVAYPIGERCKVELQDSQSSQFDNCCASADSNCDACAQPRRADRSVRGETSEVINGSDREKHGSCCAPVINTSNELKPHNGQMQKLGRRFTPRCEMHLQDIPNTLDELGRLNATFVEYMMGLPVGWVTDTGLSRTQQLKMLGNGVVPQQAEFAIRQILNTPSDQGFYK